MRLGIKGFCGLNAALALGGLLAAGSAWAQSGSLYSSSAEELDRAAAERYGSDGRSADRDDGPRLNRDVSRYTSVYARRPDPERYEVNDLVTIVVREQFDTELDAEAATDKQVDFVGGISEFPRLNLSDLLNLQLRANDFTDGPIELDVNFNSAFEGEGEYSRSETITGRITARVIEVKPNGVLVIESRKTLINDGEEVVIVGSGMCRVEDITPENTVLSSQLYDFYFNKQHEGDLKDATEKGLLTRILDFVFGF